MKVEALVVPSRDVDYDESTVFFESLGVRDFEPAIATGLDRGLAYDAAIRLVVTGRILAADSAEVSLIPTSRRRFGGERCARADRG